MNGNERIRDTCEYRRQCESHECRSYYFDGLVLTDFRSYLRCYDVEEGLPPEMSQTREVKIARKTYHDLDHHAPVSACEPTTAKCVHQLSYDCTTPPRAISMKEMRIVRGTYETKNIDTPILPKPSKTPEAGNIIIPSEQKN